MRGPEREKAHAQDRAFKNVRQNVMHWEVVISNPLQVHLKRARSPSIRLESPPTVAQQPVQSASEMRAIYFYPTIEAGTRLPHACGAD